MCSQRSEATSCVSCSDLVGGRWADILDGDTTFFPLSQLGRQLLPLSARCRARAGCFERKSYPAQRREIRILFVVYYSHVRNKSAHHTLRCMIPGKLLLCVRCAVIETGAINSCYVQYTSTRTLYVFGSTTVFSVRSTIAAIRLPRGYHSSVVNGHRM